MPRGSVVDPHRHVAKLNCGRIRLVGRAGLGRPLATRHVVVPAVDHYAALHILHRDVLVNEHWCSWWAGASNHGGKLFEVVRVARQAGRLSLSGGGRRAVWQGGNHQQQEQQRERCHSKPQRSRRHGISFLVDE